MPRINGRSLESDSAPLSINTINTPLTGFGGLKYVFNTSSTRVRALNRPFIKTADYIKVATKTIEILGGLHVDDRPTDEQVNQVIEYSESVLKSSMAKGSYVGFPFRVRLCCLRRFDMT